jgi:hypothetical protein
MFFHLELLTLSPFNYLCYQKSLLLTQYFADDQIEKNEMGGACSRYGEGVVCTRFWLENLRERDQWGDPRVDGVIILRLIF